MSRATISNLGVGGTSLGHEGPQHPAAQTAFSGSTFVPIIINDSDAAVKGTMTVSFAHVDGAGTTVPGSGTEVINFELNAKSYMVTPTLTAPNVVTTGAATAQRYFTSTTTITNLETSHKTSAQVGELVYVAWA